MLASAIEKSPVVPLIQADDPAIAVDTVNALMAGGLTIMEVVLRTPSAMACMEAIARECKGALVGAGTVLTRDQGAECIARGAQFIVSPGLDDALVRHCQNDGIEIFPGTVTASEVQRAYNLGLRTVKFFPASLSGGPAMLKALSSVFREMRFMPTGGVSPDNLTTYLSIPAVIGCGGSWLTPADAIASGDFGAITAGAADALALAKTIRP